jgi:hypothetical protein
MTLTEPAPTEVGPVERRPAEWLRLGLVVGCVAYAVLVCVVGLRQQTYADLREAVRAGEVDEVRVTPGLDPGSRGSATVRVTWDAGLLHGTTQVVETTSVRRATRTLARGDVTAVLPGTVAERLRRLDPDLRIHEEPWPSSTTESAGFVLPGWMVWFNMGLLVAVLLSVRRSPWSWGATRWAWLWLVASGPIGLAAYLVLAGPLPGRRRPRPDAWRMTGGWAFLLVIVFGTLWGW